MHIGISGEHSDWQRGHSGWQVFSREMRMTVRGCQERQEKPCSVKARTTSLLVFLTGANEPEGRLLEADRHHRVPWEHS